MAEFSPLILVMFVLLGSCAGFLAGLLGIGGGILLVPLFMWAFPIAGFAPDIVVHAAFGTSLAIIVPTAVSSTLGHRKRGNVDWRQVTYLACGGVVGAVLGASLAAHLPGKRLQLLFGVMQIIVALRMYWSRKYLPPENPQAVAPLPLLLVGLAGGAFSAFFGVGGGVIAVPLMIILVQLPAQRAVGNSSALIVISSLAGAISYLLHGLNLPNLPPYSLGYVNLLVLVLVAPFTILCARLGVRIAAGLPHAKLVRVFSLLLVVVGLRVIIRVLG
jgi:uncharacterized membrane protein YfcA